MTFSTLPQKINSNNIILTLSLVTMGIYAGIISKLPTILINFQNFDWIPSWILSIAHIVVVVSIIIFAAATIHLLIGTCGMTGRMR